MKAEWRIWKYELPLTAPVSLAPGVAMNVREGLLLELVGEDGRSFWGEAAPLPGFSRESLEDVRAQLESAVAKASHTENPRRSFAADFDSLTSASPSSGSPSVEFALASAFGGLEGADGGCFGSAPDPGDDPAEKTSRREVRRAGERSDGRSLPEPHASSEHSVAVCGLLSGSRDEILADAAKLRKNGYEAVKLKVGRRDVADDAALVGEVRDALGSDVSLRLDANRAWSFDGAMEFARLVEGALAEFIEEPLEEPSRLRELSGKSGLPVGLDESLAEMGLDEADGHGYARAFVMKPSILGHSRTLSLASVANNIGAKCIISSSYESGVGTMGLLRLAASIGGGAAGLDTYRRLADDVLSPPLELSRPRVDMREMLGAAREVDYGKLERLV